MLYAALFFLVSTLILGVMSIGAVASGSAASMFNIFYISAGLFFALLITDTVRKGIREKKSKAEFAKKLEEAYRGNS